jgi:hypothetical protein
MNADERRRTQMNADGDRKQEAKGGFAICDLLICRFADLRFAICHLLFVIFLLWRPLFAGQSFFWGTPLLQFVPWQRMAATMWRAGYVPLWNPLAGCGAPLAANYQAAAFYPLNLLYLLLPAEVALSWTTVLHLALAGWGMYCWGRAVGLERFPATIGAFALSGSGFLVARVALFPSMAFTFPWLAVWLWRAETLVQGRRLRDGLWLGVALGLGLLAGHAQTAFYGVLLLVAYVVFRVVQGAGRTRMRRIGGAGGEEQGSTLPGTSLPIYQGARSKTCSLFIVSLLIGLSLAAVQLLPTAELMLQSQRPAGVGYDFAMTYSMWPWRLITLAAPDFFGNPARGDYWGYATYWEDAAYVGVLPLLLAVQAVLGQKRREGRTTVRPEQGVSMVRFWAVCALVALVLALGKNTPVFPFLFRHVPGFNLFQAPARWLAVTTVAVAALAALGAQGWLAGRHGRRREPLGVVVGVALLIAGVAAARLIPGLRPTFGLATARLGGTLAVAGVLGLLRRDAAWWRMAVVAFVALDLLLFGWPLVRVVDRALYGGGTETARFLASLGMTEKLRDEPAPVRVYWPTDPAHPRSEYDAEYRVRFGYLTFNDFGPRDVAHWREMREALLPNAGMLDGVATANNFDPLLVGRYADLVEAVPAAPGLLRIMGVTHVASDRPWPGGEPVYTSPSATLYRLPAALGRAWVVPAARQVPAGETLSALADPAFDPAAQVLLEAPISNLQSPTSNFQSPTSNFQPPILQDTPNRVTIHAVLDAPGYLVLADTWYPGWQATVDGVPAEILRANYAFRTLRLEAGEHMVEMVYRPTLVLVGGVVSLVALVLLGAGLLWAHRRVA